MSTTTNGPVGSLQVSQKSANLRAWVEGDLFGKLFWGLLFLGIGPFLVPYFISLWKQELYQYFPFVLIGVGALAYSRWDRVLRTPAGFLQWTGLIIGAILLLTGAAIHSAWLGAVSFVVFCTVWLFAQTSPNNQSLGYLAIPLVMLIRLPQLHAQSLVVRLQKVTSSLASLCLDVLRVPQDTHAHSIRLENKHLFVAEACSGIQSAFTMCFLALLLVVWRRRPIFNVPLYIAVALLLAVLSNTIRVTVIALAEAWYSTDLSEGFLHDLIGYVSLAASAGLLLSFDYFATLILHPIDGGDVGGKSNPFILFWNWLQGVSRAQQQDLGYGWTEAGETAGKSANPDTAPAQPNAWRRNWGLIGLVAISCVAGVMMVGGWLAGRTDRRAVTSKEAILFDPPADFLKGQMGNLMIGEHRMVRDGEDPQLGKNADIWVCGTERTSGQVVMSQPFVGWHELCVCYEVQDWKLTERFNQPVAAGKPIAVGKFKKEKEGAFGYLFFTAIDSDGSVPTPPSYTLMGRIFAPFVPLITDDYAETSGSAQTIMLQMWSVTSEELTDEELRNIANSIASIREATRDSIVDYQTQLLTSTK